MSEHGHKIYLASSWRNERQPELVRVLRQAGHAVYDFRHPAPRDNGFSWSEIDPDWQGWTPRDFIAALRHPAAERGFANDRDALHWCNTLILLLPCGRSAHLEAGFAAGGGKRVLILLPPGGYEPELMYRLAHDLVTDVPGLLKALQVQGEKENRREPQPVV